MEENQDGEGDRGVEATKVDGRSVIGEDNRVISETDYTQNQDDHDGPQTTECCTELEYIPSHHRPQSVHDFTVADAQQESLSLSVDFLQAQRQGNWEFRGNEWKFQFSLNVSVSGIEGQNSPRRARPLGLFLYV